MAGVGRKKIIRNNRQGMMPSLGGIPTTSAWLSVWFVVNIQGFKDHGFGGERMARNGVKTRAN